MLQAIAIAATATLTLPANATSLATMNRTAMVAAGLSDGQIVVWNGRDKTSAVTVKVHDTRVLAVGSNADGTEVWSVAGDGSLGRTSIAAGARRSATTRLDIGAERLRAAAFSADGAMLVTGGDRGEVRVFDTASGALKRTLRGHRTELQAIAVRPGAATIASSSAESDLRLWDGASGRSLSTVDGDLSVFAAAFSPRDGTLASGGADRKVTLRNGKSFKPEGELSLHKPSIVGSIAWSPDARQMAVSDVDDLTLSKGTIHVVDATTLAVLGRLDTKGVPPTAVVYSSDGAMIVGGAGRGLMAWAAPGRTPHP